MDLNAPSFQRPAVFVGRRAELARLDEALARVPVALLCGVGGVGKSALAAAFAATWSGLVVKADVTGELAELIEDTARLLGGTIGPGPLDDRIGALADRVDGAGGLWLIDDLHRLDPAERRTLLRVLAARLRRARALATSRERVGIEAGGPDHAELRIGGLDDGEARELWLVLDTLYGVSEGLDVALARYGGNPFLLRRAHAGSLTDEDPVAESIMSLEGDARRVAGAVALSEIRLPVSLLDQLVEGSPGRELLRALADRLIIDVHADGSVSMHDLVRDAMRQALAPDERAALHEVLADRLRDADLDPARRAREACRHMRELDRHEEAARYLIERGGELDRYGAAGELLRGLEAIPSDRRTPEASIALAQVSARVLDLPRAFAEHERLLTARIGPWADLAPIHALLGLWTGQPERASRSVQELMAES